MSDSAQIGSEVRSVIARGGLVNDDLISRIVLEKLKSLDYEEMESSGRPNGWLLDGFPRTRKQMVKLIEALHLNNSNGPDLLIRLDVPSNILLERILGRRIDPTNGRVYHMTSDPPDVNDKELLLV